MTGAFDNRAPPTNYVMAFRAHFAADDKGRWPAYGLAPSNNMLVEFIILTASDYRAESHLEINYCQRHLPRGRPRLFDCRGA